MDVRDLEKGLEKLNVLFVCGANKGRSALAHAAVLYYRDNSFYPEFLGIDSGGIKDQTFYDQMTRRGELGVPEEIRNIALEKGYELINNHVAKPVTQKMLEKADLVLTFDTNVRDSLINKVKSASDVHKIQTITGYVYDTEGLNWENNDTADAQKFEGKYRKLCPHFKEDGSVDMIKIWRDTRHTSSKNAIYKAFSQMVNDSVGLGVSAIKKAQFKIGSKKHYLL